MSLKICFINSPVLSVLEPWYDEPNFVRTGLACLAGYLREHCDAEIQIIDCKFERLDFKQAISRISEYQPDIIGFTAYTNEIKPAAYLASHVKDLFPKCLTIIGGVHITALPVETLEEFKSFDIGVFGEGEETILEVYQKFSNGEKFENISGVVYREEQKIIKNKERFFKPDINEFPLPAWDLLPSAELYYIQTSRGCPYNCGFCMNPNGKIARMRDVENIIQELSILIHDHQAKKISFGDEIFSIDMQRSHDLMDAMIDTGISKQIEWDVQTHVNYVDDSLFEKFKKANVTIVELGVETGDAETLKKMGKGTNLDAIFKACQSAAKAKVPFGTFLLFGQPNETVQSLKNTIDIAVKINPDIPMFGIMTPYPGTEVASFAARGMYGYKLLSTDWDVYNKQIGGALEFAHITRKDIEKYQLIGYLSVYIKNFRLWDLTKFIWKYHYVGLQILKKIFTKSSEIHSKKTIPSDYQARTNHSITIDKDKLLTSREYWKEVQKKNLSHLKKIK